MEFRIGYLVFEWDDRKAAVNAEKHGVALEDAATIFMDGSAKTYYDPDHSHEEDLYFTIGFARSGRLITVWYTERGDRVAPDRRPARHISRAQAIRCGHEKRLVTTTCPPSSILIGSARRLWPNTTKKQWPRRPLCALRLMLPLHFQVSSR
jgi:uncharacterized DUF497 family protein